MPTLIVEQNGSRRGGTLRGRVVIGRRPGNHICIPDRAVSRIHAWIGQENGGYFVMDTGSRAGTRVNGRPLASRVDLFDGDRIRIGTVDITYRADAQLPPGVEEIDLSDRSLASDDGIFVDCACGAPLWAPWDFGGRVGQCRYCGQMVPLPKPKTKPAEADLSAETVFGGMPAIREDHPAPAKKVSVIRRPAPAAPLKPSLFDGRSPTKHPIPAPVLAERSAQSLCGACQSPISILEESTQCPECGVTFHADCWKENCGCSSYGCAQVGVLAKTLREPIIEKELMPSEPVELEDLRRVPWEYPLLAGALLAAAVGSLTFGLPPVLLLIAIGWMWPKVADRRNRKTLAAAAALSLLASIAGAWFSWYWWLDSVQPGGGR